jgi:hypothetical protein
MRRTKGRGQVSVLGLTVAAIAAFAVVGLMASLLGPSALGVLVGGFGALGLAGWLWGADTVDGCDWCPRESESWR